MKVITDEQKIDELLERGVENIYPNKEALKKLLMSGKRIKLYCGYDPTAKSLHIGNAISINKLGQFQKLGHEVIFLVGDFTGMIGDPTDKSAVRQKLTQKETKENSKNYKKQASGYLNFGGFNRAKILRNSKWSNKLSFADLVELTSNFTVSQMLERDMFENRMKEGKPIFIHEFLYPIAQAYDSVAMNVDLEIGGNDQTFNMLRGRDLLKTKTGKEKFVLTLKLLADETGKKMGKTEGNVVNLDSTPEDMFGAVMSWSDGLIFPGFELCTNITKEELSSIKKELASADTNPKDLKMQLAFEITKINHGEHKAKLAQESFINTFQKKEVPENIPEFKIEGEEKLGDLLVRVGVVSSKSEWRRLVEEGAVSFMDTGSKIDDPNAEPKQGMLLKIGKRRFVKII